MNRYLIVVALLVGVGCSNREEAQARAREASKREEAQQLAALKIQIAKREARIYELQVELVAQNDVVARERASLGAATNDAERAASRARLATAETQVEQTKEAIRKVEGVAPRDVPSSPRPGASPCACDAGDPLCACL